VIPRGSLERKRASVRYGGWMESLFSALGAASLVAIGLGLGFLSRALAARLLRLVSVRLSTQAAAVGAGTVAIRFGARALTRPTIAVISDFIFWVVFIIFLAAATETLGVPMISAWLTAVALYMPRVVAAVLVALVGVLAGNLARQVISGAATSAGINYAQVIGRITQTAILLVTAVVAVDQLGIQTTFIVVIASISVAALLGGAALAFGLGARTAASNIIAAHYLVKTYGAGDRVRIGDVEGRILEITSTAVILDTADGRTLVPAKDFGERASLLLGSAEK
jgi:hypothetical protein